MGLPPCFPPFRRHWFHKWKGRDLQLVFGRWRVVLQERLVVASLLFAGLAERVLWCLLRPTVGAAGEATKVAVALAQGKGFADAYTAGQGPTAHLLPLPPLWAGGIYTLFGIKTLTAEFILAAYAISLALGTYLLLYRAFQHLGVPRWARLGALGFACVAPTYLSQEAVDFRTWEGGLAAFLAALFLLVLVEPRIRSLNRRTFYGACLASLLFFVNPPLGASAFTCALVFGLRRLSPAQFARAVLFATVTLAALFGPWTLRNARVMHAPIVLRSNAGLELALANYPGALDREHPRDRFLERIAAIHPVSRPAYARMEQAGGEVAYANKLGVETKQWIGQHPASEARLLAMHGREMVFPRRWQFDIYGRNLSPALRAILADLAGVLGLAGIVVALVRRKGDWLYPAAMVLIPTLLVMPFQPVPRYTYLIYPTLVFCAAQLIASLWGAARGRFVAGRPAG